MASKYKKGSGELKDMAEIVMRKFHGPLVEAKVRIDFMFAYGERDENDNLIAPALMHYGAPARGIARQISYKDRVKGLGDAEIVVDADWWKDAPDEQKRALLDHELQHFAITDKVDDLGRPKLKMRKHDVQIGWFKSVALRHGASSQEQIQAKMMFDEHGQAFFPGLTKTEGAAGRMAHVEVHEKPGK